MPFIALAIGIALAGIDQLPLDTYRSYAGKEKGEAWDELEKSIIASISFRGCPHPRKESGNHNYKKVLDFDASVALIAPEA